MNRPKAKKPSSRKTVPFVTEQQRAAIVPRKAPYWMKLKKGQTRQLHLGIALDLAQMFTREYGSKLLVEMDGVELVKKLVPIHDRIHGLHLWGRGKGGGAHSGNLDGLFEPSTSAKAKCLEVLHSMFSEGHRTAARSCNLRSEGKARWPPHG